MDRNRNENIDEPIDEGMAGTGQQRERGTEKMRGARTDSDIRRGNVNRQPGEPSGGSGDARPADKSAHDQIPSKSFNL